MRKIREVLRLKFEAGLSDSRIAQAIGSARSTVQECLRRAKAAGIGWPLAVEFDEALLQGDSIGAKFPSSVSRSKLQSADEVTDLAGAP